MNMVGRPPLDLAPFPTSPSHQNSPFANPSESGFVDDSVIEDILRRSSRPVVLQSNQELALSADDMDFAGWHTLSRPVSVPAAPAPSKNIEAPPVIEPGLGTPQRDTPKWWVAALATAGSVIALSLSLMTAQQGAGKQTHPAIQKSKMVIESIRQTVRTGTSNPF